MKANISGAGKGSATRPVDAKKFGDNYDKIFGKKDADNGAEVATTFPATLFCVRRTDNITNSAHGGYYEMVANVTSMAMLQELIDQNIFMDVDDWPSLPENYLDIGSGNVEVVKLGLAFPEVRLGLICSGSIIDD